MEWKRPPQKPAQIITSKFVFSIVFSMSLRMKYLTFMVIIVHANVCCPTHTGFPSDCALGDKKFLFSQVLNNESHPKSESVLLAEKSSGKKYKLTKFSRWLSKSPNVSKLIRSQRVTSLQKTVVCLSSALSSATAHWVRARLDSVKCTDSISTLHSVTFYLGIDRTRSGSGSGLQNSYHYHLYNLIAESMEMNCFHIKRICFII